MAGFTGLLVGLLFVGVMIWRVVRRGYQMRDLVQRGIPVTGEVVNKVKFHGSSGIRSRYLRYRFRAADGNQYSHKINISSSENEKYQEGRPIELVYLPDNPKVSATAAMVEMVRDAMQRQKQK